MDSGNSASLQSSSGGDDEFDSRCGGADSTPLSALLRHPPPPSSVPGFGGDHGSLIYGLQELRTPPLSQSHWCSTTTAPPPAGADASASPPSLAAMAADQADGAPAPPQRSRKRARASRRAPTTVLTTDTSNFRAMVQEFTGIPAPPFAGGATATATATARSRFDHLLFPLRTGTGTAGTASPAALPQYLLRPFAHKLHPYPPSFTSPSTSSPAPANISIAPACASTTTHGTNTTALASSSDSYHQHQLTAASTSALLGMQQDHSNNCNYLSFHQSSSVGGDGKYAAAHPAFDRGIAPPPPPSSATRLQDPPDFLGLTYEHDVMGPHAHLHLRNGGDELSGMVGGASVTGTAGCKAMYSSTRPLLQHRSRRNQSAGGSAATATTVPVAATAGMRTQAGVVDSWVCTSD